MLARKFTGICILVVLTLFVGPRPLCAQDEQQPPGGNKPKAAGSTYPIPIVNGSDQQDQDNNPLTPDTTPLTGIFTPTLGAPGLQHSYWVPGFEWSGAIQSRPYNQTQNSGWLMNNYLVGNLSLIKAWGHNQLAVNYSGGGYVSTDSVQGNGYYQQLALSQTFIWNRWQLQLQDQFSYLPESSFGFGGSTGLGAPGTGGTLGPVIPGISNNNAPNQGIFASIGPRYSNTSAAQFNYATSPRGSITFGGSYGLLDFVDAGNVDNNIVTGSFGYNYALSREDTIGAFYRFSSFHYPGQPQANGDHSFNFAYGRKITGRLALQLYAGPDFTTSRIHSAGDSLNYGVNVGSSLQYSVPNGGLSLSYTHGTSGGSGVLVGSTNDQLSLGLNHRLTRLWSGQLNFGYSHNSPISSATQTNTQSYNTWTVGGGLSRPLGRNANFGLSYTAQFTDYGLAGCVGAACTSNQTYHYVTLDLQWHARPFVLP